MGKYKVVDLFAGAGGLSLGFVKTGKYDIKVAFENNPNMQETYRRNHPKVDVRGVSIPTYEDMADEILDENSEDAENEDEEVDE